MRETARASQGSRNARNQRGHMRRDDGCTMASCTARREHDDSPRPPSAAAKPSVSGPKAIGAPDVRPGLRARKNGVSAD